MISKKFTLNDKEKIQADLVEIENRVAQIKAENARAITQAMKDRNLDRVNDLLEINRKITKIQAQIAEEKETAKAL